MVYIALKAAQQLNVVHGQFKLVMPTSIGMATCEFFIVGYMVSMGPSVGSVIAVGSGAGLGAMAVMYFYRRKKL